MLLSRGNFMTFLEHPISATIMALTALVLIWGVWSSLKARRAARARPAEPEPL